MKEVTEEQIAAFEERLAARAQRRESEVPKETPEDLQQAYLKRTGRTRMKAETGFAIVRGGER